MEVWCPQLSGGLHRGVQHGDTARKLNQRYRRIRESHEPRGGFVGGQFDNILVQIIHKKLHAVPRRRAYRPPCRVTFLVLHEPSNEVRPAPPPVPLPPRTKHKRIIVAPPSIRPTAARTIVLRLDPVDPLCRGVLVPLLRDVLRVPAHLWGVVRQVVQVGDADALWRGASGEAERVSEYD